MKLLEKINLPVYMSDLAGRVMIVEDDLTIELTEKLVAKNIGKLYEELDGTVTYYKHEDELNIFRKFNGWSILEVIGKRVDKVIYESKTCIYECTKEDIQNFGIIWGSAELEKKIIVPLDVWKKTVKSGKLHRRLELFGHQWYNLLQSEIDSDWFNELGSKVASLRQMSTVFPAKDDVFKVFKLLPYQTKVLILGQDPYYNSLADGLAFSSNNPEVTPDSLRNIFKEIEKSFNTLLLDPNPDLTRWHKQGVFLLNTCLTVEAGKPLSHSNLGWEKFTNRVISVINDFDKPIVFMLWGAHARKYKDLITNKKHLILESVHPSPLSANKGFFGNNHFVDANKFLISNNIDPIDWT